MEFVDILKSKVAEFFETFDTGFCHSIAKNLKTTGLDLGFDRTGNSTDHRSTLAELRGTPVSRVSLDKYVDGTPTIVINRMQATSAEEVFISAVHGAILAWRRASGARTEDGRERLIDNEFTEAAQYVGLMKTAAERLTMKDGKEVKVRVPDSNKRVWFKGNAGLTAVAKKFADEAPPLPTAYIGTDARNHIGTILLPCTVTTPAGKYAGFYRRIPSYSAAELKREKDGGTNKALDLFEVDLSNVNFTFDQKNKGFKLLAALCELRKAAKDPATQPEADVARQMTADVNHPEQNIPAAPASKAGKRAAA